VLYELHELRIFEIHAMFVTLVLYLVIYLLPCCCFPVYGCCMCQSMMIKMFRDVYDVNLFKLKCVGSHAYSFKDGGLCPGVFTHQRRGLMPWSFAHQRRGLMPWSIFMLTATRAYALDWYHMHIRC